jgi:hypothetical protein
VRLHLGDVRRCGMALGGAVGARGRVRIPARRGALGFA